MHARIPHTQSKLHSLLVPPQTASFGSEHAGQGKWLLSIQVDEHAWIQLPLGRYSAQPLLSSLPWTRGPSIKIKLAMGHAMRAMLWCD